MRKNKAIKREMEQNCGLRLRELCEVLNPPEYRRKDFRLGMSISDLVEIYGEQPNYFLNEIRDKRLKVTVFDRKVRIKTEDFFKWLET